jgi:hypothetical protein
MVHIHVQQPPEANQPESEIYFPWFQLNELVLASKDLYNERAASAAFPLARIFSQQKINN